MQDVWQRIAWKWTFTKPDGLNSKLQVLYCCVWLTLSTCRAEAHLGRKPVVMPVKNCLDHIVSWACEGIGWIKFSFGHISETLSRLS